MAKTILVTGAGGYIGRHVLDALSEYDGVEVIALDMRKPDDSPRGVRWVEANLFDPAFDLEGALGCVPDACLHLAWRNGFEHNNPSHMEDLSGHYRFLEKVVWAGIPQVAIMGSMHEVGYWEGAIDEDTPCNPQSLYGIAKDALRRSSKLLCEGEGAKWQWLRGFYIHGDDAKSQSIFGKITRAAADGQKTFPFTTGKNLYDFLTVRELGRQIAACVVQDEVCGIINCCSGEPVSLADEIEGFIADSGFDIALDYGAFPDRPYDSPGIWGDAAKIRAIMGGTGAGAGAPADTAADAGAAHC